MNKTRYLVCHDYGQGGLWAYVCAESPQEIKEKFRDLDIISEPPANLTPQERATLPIYDIDSPDDWLAMLVKN